MEAAHSDTLEVDVKSARVEPSLLFLISCLMQPHAVHGSICLYVVDKICSDPFFQCCKSVAV